MTSDLVGKLLGDGVAEATAIDDRVSGAVITYGVLRETVATTAALFAQYQRGLSLVLCRTDVATITGYLASLAAGHAVALVDADAPDYVLEDLIGRYHPDFVLGSATVRRGYSELAPNIAGRQSPSTRLHPELALMLATSGTTGSPRFARLSATAVYQNAAAIVQYLGIDSDERPVLALPLHYSFGLSILNSHLIAGATVVIPRGNLVSREFWGDVDSAGCTSLSGVPYTFEVLERLGFLRQRSSTIRTLAQAGGRLDPGRARRFGAAMQSLGGRMFVMYGQTEATARISYVPPATLETKAHTVGVPIPGGSLDVAPMSDGDDVRPNGEGELLYRGPNVMLGYADTRLDCARGDDQHGELRTGDRGYRDSDGFFVITGRNRRIAKLFGSRLNLDDIEAKASHFGRTAVVTDDSRVVLFCEWGSPGDFANAARQFADAYRLHTSAFEFRRIEAIPMLANGKINYRRLSC